MTESIFVRNKKKQDVKKLIFSASFLALPMLNFFIFYVYVNIDAFVMAFQRPDYLATGMELSFSLDNFRNIFSQLNQSGEVIEALRNTFLFWGANMLIISPLSFLMSYFIYKKIVGKRLFRAIFYLPVIITSSAIVVLFKYAIGDGGVLDAFYTMIGKEFVYPLTQESSAIWTIIIYNISFGFGGKIVILGGSLAGVDSDVLEAGYVDGCNWFQEFTRLIIPMIWPTVSTMLILDCAGFMGASGPILAFTKGADGTLTLNYLLYDLVAGVSRSPDPYYASSIGILMTAITFPLVLLVRRFVYGEREKEVK